MYISDFICTYKLLKDQDDSDELYRLQFLQIFDCLGGYNEQKVQEGLEDAYKTILSCKYGNKWFDLVWNVGLPSPMCCFLTHSKRDKHSDLLLIQAYYSWITMDLVHKVVCKIKNDSHNENQVTWDELFDIVKQFALEHKINIPEEK